MRALRNPVARRQFFAQFNFRYIITISQYSRTSRQTALAGTRFFPQRRIVSSFPPSDLFEYFIRSLLFFNRNSLNFSRSRFCFTAGCSVHGDSCSIFYIMLVMQASHRYFQLELGREASVSFHMLCSNIIEHVGYRVLQISVRGGLGFYCVAQKADDACVHPFIGSTKHQSASANMFFCFPGSRQVGAARLQKQCLSLDCV